MPRRDESVVLRSPRSVAEGSLECAWEASEDVVVVNGKKAGSSSSSSSPPSSDLPAVVLFVPVVVKRGRRRTLDWVGYLLFAMDSEEEDAGDVVSDGGERGTGRGERVGK